MREGADEANTFAQATDSPLDALPQQAMRSTLLPADATQTAHEHELPRVVARCDYPILEDWSSPEEQESLRRAATTILRASDDPDALAAAALLVKSLGTNQRTLLNAIDQAIAESPDDPVLRLLSYDLCIQRQPEGTSGVCSETERQQRLKDWIDRDAGNGTAWATLALASFLADNRTTGLTALANAASGSTATMYFVDLVERMETALYGAGMPFPDSAGYGLAIAATIHRPIGLAQYCRNNAPTDAVLRQHCFGYYELLAETSNTLIGQSIGLTLQVQLSANDPSRDEQRRQLKIEKDAVDRRKQAIFDQIHIHNNWMFSDRSRFYAYINGWRAIDELTSVELSHEARRRHEARFNCSFAR